MRQRGQRRSLTRRLNQRRDLCRGEAGSALWVWWARWLSRPVDSPPMLTPESVLALAPDESSAKAARGLVAPAQWPSLGFDDTAVWGECKGSGSKPYQTQVDL